jgi:hypothetical protein
MRNNWLLYCHDLEFEEAEGGARCWPIHDLNSSKTTSASLPLKLTTCQHIMNGDDDTRHRKTTRVNTLQNANAPKCGHEEGNGWGGEGKGGGGGGGGGGFKINPPANGLV